MENNDECIIHKIIDFEDYYYSIKKIFIFVIISKIINLFNEKFIILLFLNIIILYAPFKTNFSDILFKIRMYLEQTWQGIIGLISCLIPKYRS